MCVRYIHATGADDKWDHFLLARRILRVVAASTIHALALVSGHDVCRLAGNEHWTIKYDFHLGVLGQNHVATVTG